MGAINQEAFERAKEANLTKEEKDAYEESLKSYRDNINVIDTARKEGREEGIKEGIKEGIYKVAKGLKAAGVDSVVIQETTGLSREEIEKL